MVGIYVHIPFCAAKCGYCDFHSLVAGEDFVGNYLAALNQEIQYYGSTLKGRFKLDTLYIGGGTPTLLTAKQLERLIYRIRQEFSFYQTAEMTIEANPKTLTSEKVAALKRAGINRVSLGAQAFQDDLLHTLGRIHSAQDITDSVRLLQQGGIANINLDLIYALPNQTVAHWQSSLNQAVELGIKHLSCYSLIIEPDTPFAELNKRQALELPAEDDELEMFEYTIDFLADRGFSHYEISNFAYPTYESRHNSLYWQSASYLGVGSGAHGYLDRTRYANTRDLKQYIASWQSGEPALDYNEELSDSQQMDEFMMVGLRMLHGVNDEHFISRFDKSLFDVYRQQIRTLHNRGLVEVDGNRIKLTRAGVFLGNQVFSAFIR